MTFSGTLLWLCNTLCNNVLMEYINNNLGLTNSSCSIIADNSFETQDNVRGWGINLNNLNIFSQ